MRTAIITGASRGLGLSLTEALVAEGWHVVVDARDRDTLEAATRPLGPNVQALPGDIADPVHRHDLVAAAWDVGGLALVVNNASTLGPSPLPPLRHLPLAALADTYRVNVEAPLGLIQEALPLLAVAGGAIVNVTSDAAVEAYPGWGGYGSSKAALEQLSAVLAAEEADVRVWWVDPGDMRTQMHQDAFPGEDISDRPEPSAVVPGFLRLIHERPPSGRYQAAELAAGDIRAAGTVTP